MKDQRYYEIVAEELQHKFLRPGLWTRAVAEAGREGDAAARSLYIRFRVAEIKQEEQTRADEAERQTVEEARARNQAERLAQEEFHRRRAQEEEAERWRVDTERAASPYFGLFVFGGIIGALLLAFVLAYILSR